jgi:hypothetical protein
MMIKHAFSVKALIHDGLTSTVHVSGLMNCIAGVVALQR